jgi:hypothetical protein
MVEPVCSASGTTTSLSSLTHPPSNLPLRSSIQNMSFASMENDPITKTQVRRLIAAPAVKNGFAQLLQRGSSTSSDKDRQLVSQLVDLLDKVSGREV